MDVFLEAIRDPGNMTRQQWLLVVIMLFVIAGGIYFVWRLYRIIEADRKSTYVPNIGRRRLNNAGADDETDSGRAADDAEKPH